MDEYVKLIAFLKLQRDAIWPLYLLELLIHSMAGFDWTIKKRITMEIYENNLLSKDYVSIMKPPNIESNKMLAIVEENLIKHFQR